MRAANTARAPSQRCPHWPVEMPAQLCLRLEACQSSISRAYMPARLCHGRSCTVEGHACTVALPESIVLVCISRSVWRRPRSGLGMDIPQVVPHPSSGSPAPTNQVPLQATSLHKCRPAEFLALLLSAGAILQPESRVPCFSMARHYRVCARGSKQHSRRRPAGIVDEPGSTDRP